MKIGNYDFNVKNNTYVMGILNVTPDSFSDGGKWFNMDDALRHCESMINEGASIIDIGGESTRPGYKKISAGEEIERVIPVIDRIRSSFDIPVSVDTYKSEVAAEAVRHGADMVNDIWGLKADPEMGRVIAQSGAACCLMHNKSEAVYNDFTQDFVNETLECVSLAKQAGIAEDRIILDPGIGFGKTYEMNLLVLRNLNKLTDKGYPVLLGCSRKSVIGLTLDLPADQRLEGTLVTTVSAVMSGCAFVRVHDVRENLRAIRMTRAILGK